MKKYIKSTNDELEYESAVNDYKKWKKDYAWVIKKYPETANLYNQRGDIGTCTIVHYEKDGNRWDEVDRETVDMNTEYYMNVVSAAPFFKNLGGYERLEAEYVRYGYMPTESISISPDRTERVVRQFRFNND